MSIVKTFRFPASVRWHGGRLTSASCPEKADLEIATPPEFRGGVHGVWSPEELLVASTASCFALTLAAVADRSEMPLGPVTVDGVGHVERAMDGRFRFTVIELTVEVGADSVDAVEHLLVDAERLCIVSLALDVPVHVRVVVTESSVPVAG